MQYQEYTDGVNTYRDGVRDEAYVVDKELTPLGFDGIESTDGGITGDWIELLEIKPE